MSVPITAAACADAIGPLLEAIDHSIGHKTSIQRYKLPDRVFFGADIHAYNRCFSGNGEVPARALMKAHTSLQDFEDKTTPCINCEGVGSVLDADVLGNPIDRDCADCDGCGRQEKSS